MNATARSWNEDDLPTLPAAVKLTDTIWLASGFYGTANQGVSYNGQIYYSNKYGGFYAHTLYYRGATEDIYEYSEPYRPIVTMPTSSFAKLL